MDKKILRVSQLMTKKTVTVEMDDSLSMVKDIFDNTRFHHLLVVDNNQLCGVISDRDLFKALSPNINTAAETHKDAASLRKKVHQIMTRKLITLLPEADVYDAIHIFNQENISCIPIVDGNKKIKGILSWRDILRALEDKRRASSNR